MKIKFWGVRGSLPSSSSPTEAKEQFALLLREFLDKGYKTPVDVDKFLAEKNLVDVSGYGVATTCVQVKSNDDEQMLIIDGGSGIKYLSDTLAKNRFAQKEYHILITHFHFDHILGLPFFAPHFIPGCTVKYYCVQPECEKIVRDLFQKPIFPVGYEDLKANIQFIKLSPYEKRYINGFAVTPYLLDHPDPCYGFRIEHDGKAYGHAVDTEATRTTPEQLGQDAGLYQNLDLMYIDAQYVEEEMNHKKGWGHGTFERAFNLCGNFAIKQVYMAHYDPSASLKDIQNIKERARATFEKHAASKTTVWDFAYETQEVEL